MVRQKRAICIGVNEYKNDAYTSLGVLLHYNFYHFIIHGDGGITIYLLPVLTYEEVHNFVLYIFSYSIFYLPAVNFSCRKYFTNVFASQFKLSRRCIRPYEFSFKGS